MRGSQGRCYSRMGLVCSAGRQPPSLSLFLPSIPGFLAVPPLIVFFPSGILTPPSPPRAIVFLPLGMLSKVGDADGT